MPETQTLPTIEEILKDPCTHYHLKEAIELFITKDPVDAANDAAILAALMERRCKQLLGAGY